VGSAGVSGANGTASQVGWLPSAQYGYVADAPDAAKTSVLASSGVGKF